MEQYFENLDLNNITYFCEIDLVQKIEQWKAILNYEDRYHISDLGRIKSLNYNNEKRFAILKQLKRKGYLKINLSKDGVAKNIFVHRLVAIHFIPNPENKPDVNHIGLYPDGRQGNKHDNRAISLEWSTTKENNNHARTHGLIVGVSSEKCNFSKLSSKLILEIKENIDNLNQRQLGEKYGVTQSNISYILNNKSWKKTN